MNSHKKHNLMKKHPLLSYLVILALLCAGFIAGVKMLGERGMMLAQGYMLTPAVAALIVRLFFYELKFKDANLRLGKLSDYFKYWVMALGITMLSYLIFTLLRSITWDLTGQTFLDNLSQQFALAGQDIAETLPAGFTPEIMLWLFFAGGLTVFNILPGIITGFGEEFGHRGLMFPLLYKIKPWIGFVCGGLLWFAWHLPLTLVIPQPGQGRPGEIVLNYVVLGVGSLCTFSLLAYIYVKSKSVFVTSFAHIVLNNSAASFSYFVTITDQSRANLGLTITMLIVIAILYFSKEYTVLEKYFVVLESHM